MPSRPFVLMVDSSSEEEPDNQRFGSVEAALAAFDRLSPEWQRFAWVINTETSEVYMRDGQRVVPTLPH